MKFNFNFLGLILVLLIGCKEESKIDLTAIDTELELLTTTEAKRNFLENLAREDQKLRQGQISEILIKFGKNSEELHEFVKTQNSLDLLNLVKVEKYLNKFGYPSKSEFGETASSAPWIIIHHSPTYEDRERSFKIIYQAFLNGDIDREQITMYLGRMYEIKNGERLQMNNPYTAEEEIERLIKELSLE